MTYNVKTESSLELKFSKIPVMIQNEQGFIVKYILKQVLSNVLLNLNKNFSAKKYSFITVLINILQSNLYAKATQGKLKM